MTTHMRGRPGDRPRAEIEFQAVLADAEKLYEETSGQSIDDYLTPPMKSIDDLKHQLDVQNESFSTFRAKRESIFGALSAMLKPVEMVGDVVSGAMSEMFPPTQTIYSAVMYLVNAANNVSSTYDSILELFDQIKDFTLRLNVYIQHQMSAALRGKVVSIFAALFRVLVLATKEVRRGRVKLYFKNLIGSESHVQPALERLKKLTLGEERQVIADTYGGVAHISTTTDRVENLVSQVDQNVQDLRSEYRERTSVAHQDKLREILEPSPFPEDFYSSFDKARVGGTGDWLLEDSGLQSWLQGDTQYLWISGGAGTGKSFLATRLVSWSSDNLPHSAYFYFRSNNPETRSVLQALRDVAYQLSESDAFYGRQVTKRVHSGDDIKTIPSAFRTLFVQPFEEDPRGKALHVFLDGVDEAEPREMEELLEQLAPENDETQSRGLSRVKIALVGRSYMTEAITSHLDRPNTGPTLTVIQVTPDRNAEDVKAYIEDSVHQSRILSRSSRDFKRELIETMETRVDGLFILAKFMIADVNRRRRPSSILKSLQSFPREINGMLKKTLANLASTITEEEAADLNEMLRWVACAEQALTLEQLEAALALRFGEPPFLLEDTLRGQYACFFELEREDGRTTDDLTKDYERLQQNSKRDSTPNGRPRRSSSVGRGSPNSPSRNISPAQKLNEGTRRRTSPVALGTSPGRAFSPSRSPIQSPMLFDLDREVEFRSKKSTTTVTFFHASVREFFRDHDTAAATTDTRGPAIGFDTGTAKTHILKTCLRIFNDEQWFDGKKLGQKKKAIEQYAAWYWQEHLAVIEPQSVSREDKRIIGQHLYNMLTDEGTIYKWSIMYEENDEGLEVLTDGNINALRTWMADADTLEGLSPESREWAQKSAPKPTGLLQRIGRFYAKAWLDETFDKYIPTKFCFKIVQSMAFMDAGYSWSDSRRHWPDVPVAERINKATEWAQYRKTAYWCRRVGSTYLTSGMHSEALSYYNEALRLDGNSVETFGRRAFCLFKNKRYDEALQLALECESTEEKLISRGRLPASKLSSSKWRLYKDCFLIAQCYYRVGEVEDSITYFRKAIESADGASLEHSERFEPVTGLLEVLAAEDDAAGIMKVLQDLSLQASGPLRERSRLVDLLLSEHNKALILDWIPKAACQDKQADFLVERLKISIEVAHGKRDALKELYLRLALGTTLIYQRSVDAAISIFEQISLVEYRPRGNVPTRRAHAISFQKLATLYKNMVLHAGVASHEADRWIQRLESVQAKQHAHQNFNMPASMLGSDVNVAAIYLALFYRLQGKEREAESLLSALIVESCEILEDEDLRNDEFALENLLRLFVAAGDAANATALAVSMRRLNPEASISTPGDSPIQQRAHVEPKLPDIQSSNRSCAQCLDIIRPAAEFVICWYCLDSFCMRCLKTVVQKSGNNVQDHQGDEVVCRADHEWFSIPPLDRVLHTGELLVDGQVRRFGAWKDDIKKRWERQRTTG